jgi:hypothetical protein
MTKSDYKPFHWLNSLEPEQKERVLSVMRSLEERSDSHYRKSTILTPDNGRHGVGAAHEDEAHQAEAIACVLRWVRNGTTPSKAGALATDSLRRTLKRHNCRRESDIMWKRDDMAMDGLIARTAMSILIASGVLTDDKEENDEQGNG